jgi:hypothetical protein
MGGDKWRCTHIRSIVMHTRTCVIFMHAHKRITLVSSHKKIIRRKEEHAQKPIKKHLKEGYTSLDVVFPSKQHKVTIQFSFVCFASTRNASRMKSQRRTRRALWTTLQSLEKRVLEKLEMKRGHHIPQTLELVK